MSCLYNKISQEQHKQEIYIYIFIYMYINIYRHTWASLVAQLVKNPPAMQETPVRFLGWEDPLEKGEATHCSVLGLPW